MTADGSKDNNITQESLPSNQVTPFGDFIPAAEAMCYVRSVSNQATEEDVDINIVKDNNEDQDGKGEPYDNNEE